MKTVAVLGSGTVGQVLADGFLKHGYRVMRGSRDTSKLQEWQSKAGPNASIGTFEQAAQFGQIVVLAVKGLAAEAVIRGLSAESLSEKTVIDATNPIAESPPHKGVLTYFTTPNESLMERLQTLSPNARFVKAFSSVGNAMMVNPEYNGQRPTMFICGNHEGAKQETTEILAQFGWDTQDVGPVEAARAIEPLCIVWCAIGFNKGIWTHAFALLKK
jgi:predicted dinucleotide-binding enzyme